MKCLVSFFHWCFAIIPFDAILFMWTSTTILTTIASTSTHTVYATFEEALEAANGFAGNATVGLLKDVTVGAANIGNTLDRSRAEVLRPLVLEDGKILRCDNPAVPTKDCLTKEPTVSGQIFKLQNTCNGCGILAVFNLDAEENAVSGTISPTDVVGLAGEEFAVYEHFSKELRIMKGEDSFELQLNNADEYKLYIIVPLTNGCGIIGRTDKFISPATYSYTKSGVAELVEEGPYAYMENYKLVLKE